MHAALGSKPQPFGFAALTVGHGRLGYTILNMLLVEPELGRLPYTRRSKVMWLNRSQAKSEGP